MSDNKVSVKGYFQSPQVQAKLKDLLQDRANQFTTSVLSLVGNDALLAQAEPASLFSAALTAASLDLPINKNLGFAHIIGYKNNKRGIVEAQFQIGWKGFVQLAQRTGQYRTISATEVYEGQLVKEDKLRGNTYNWDAPVNDSAKVIGYVSIFVLTTGFEHELYMSVDEVKAHGKKYSQAYKSGHGPWADNFDAMALKTVIKLNISKFGPMSTDLQKAVTLDQAVIKDDEPDYIDGTDLKLDNAKATDDELAAIAQADPVAAEAQEVDHQAHIDEIFKAEPKAPEAPKKSVKEMAAERGWSKNGKTGADNNTQS